MHAITVPLVCCALKDRSFEHTQAPAYYAPNFAYYAFEQCSKSYLLCIILCPYSSCTILLFLITTLEQLGSSRCVIYHAMLQCSYILHIMLNIMLMRKLNSIYYAGIMLGAFNNLLCSKLCWHNRPGLKHTTSTLYQ